MIARCLVLLAIVACDAGKDAKPATAAEPTRSGVPVEPDPNAPEPPPDTSWYWAAGTDFCERACSASDHAFGSSLGRQHISPPPGKAEMGAKRCRDDCKRIDDACGKARHDGEDAFATCLAAFVTATANERTGDMMCLLFALPPGVYDRCELASARANHDRIHCLRMLDAQRRAACEAELETK